jgi:uncharacterized protein (DUF58 family)
MYFTWTFIILIFGYAIAFIFLPFWTYLGLGLLCVLILWLIDCLVTLKQPKVQVERLYPSPVYQNQSARVELVITNPLRRPLRVYLKDEPPFEVRVSGSEGRLTIPARQTVSFTYEIASPKRGVFSFGNVNFKLTGELLLYKIQYKVFLPQELKVYPVLAKVGAYRFDKLIASQNEGIHKTRLMGLGGELSKLREFVSGDDYRKINWKVTAHVGKPFINEYEPEKDQNVFLLFDTGRVLFDQANETTSRFDRILDSAILLAYNILGHGDMVGALSFHYKIGRYLPVGKGIRQMQLFVSTFFDLEALMLESDYRAAFHFWQTQNKKRSLLFVYTDIIDKESSKDLIKHLMVFSRQHLVVCVILKKRYLVELAESPIRDEKGAYQKGVALELLKERDHLKRMLRNQGIAVLEVDYENIQQTVVEHYLFLKETGRF